MIKNSLFLLLFSLLLASACKNNQKNSACGTQVCTDLFAEVTVTFHNNTDTPINIQNLTVTDQRTGAVVVNQLPSTATGTYVIASDSNLKLLSAAGDNLLVTATDPATGQALTFTEKVTGGTCACHVAKVSGPEIVTFN